ncbi:MAG: hypothetical protein H7144_02155 [Burkholderiales bacterium]|nr:hypothetical protein [Phycisphaerae bacterium]
MPSTPAQPLDTNARSLSLVGWLIVAWLGMLVLGFLSLRIPGALAAANPVSVARAVFTSANVNTLTGFPQTFAAPDEFRTSVQMVFLMQLLSGALLTLIGGGVLLARVLGLPHSDSRIATTGLLMIIGAGLVGLATSAPGESLISGFSRGVGALCGSAMTFGRLRGPDDPVLNIALAPLSLMGGFGTLVPLMLYERLVRRSMLNAHALKVMTVVAGIYLLGMAAIYALGAWRGSEMTLSRGSALIMSAIGYGYSNELISELPRGTDWILMAVMLVGFGTAGTGAWGIAWLWTLPQTLLPRALIACAVQAAMLLAAVIVLSQTEPQLAAERILMLCVGSVTNVGLAHTPVAITGPGLQILAALEVAARLLPLVVMMQMLRHKALEPHKP